MFKKLFLLSFLFLLMCQCAAEDDICESGEFTPRMIVKFKSKEGKLKTLNSVFVKVDYGNGLETIISREIATDSVIIPLKVDESIFTNVYFCTTKNGIDSKVKVNYIQKSQYVSPACGIKKNYENFNPVLETPNEVTALEINQNEIINESKTHLYLIF